MGAPKGNEFWKMRSKHGRDAIFDDPEKMLDSAYNFFQWCEDNPLYEEQLIKIKIDRDREEVQHEKAQKLRPFTMQGLCSYLHCNIGYFNDFERNLNGKTDQKSKDFSAVITHIRETIYNQKFTGAASGFFNSNIIARDLGLSDKTDITSQGEKVKQVFVIGGKEIEI